MQLGSQQYINFRKQSGVSLIELMIGITISLIILSGVLVAFINLSTSSTTVIKSNRLNNELRSTLNIITRELSKAGYVNAWDNSVATDPRVRTDILSLYGNIILADVGGTCDVATNTAGTNTDTCDCILYRYDAPEAGSPTGDGLAGTDGVAGPGGAAATTINDPEFFGFRFDSANNEIDMKTGGAFADNDCTDGTWQAITSDDIEIIDVGVNPGLAFQIDHFDSFNDGTDYLNTGEVINDDNADGDCQDSGDSCLFRRKVNITITGRLAQDPTVSMTIDTEVKLMNDRYVLQP